MLYLKDDKECYYCAKCYIACKNDAIEFVIGKNGNFQPLIKGEKCIKCNRCVEACLKEEVKNSKYMYSKHYVASSKNTIKRERSASGGIFPVLAKWILQRGGIVIGATFDEEKQEICHISISNYDEIDKLQKSKYVQSNWISVLEVVERALCCNQLVLFSGTPCQVNAVRNTYGDKYENLYLVDLYCHGVSMAGLFKEYLLTLEDMPTNVDFRKKVKSDKNFYIEISGKEAVASTVSWNKNALCKLFVNSASLKRACFYCKYAEKKHVADITLGDYDDMEMAKEKGITYEWPSIIAVNTCKGEEWFAEINRELEYAQLDENEGIKNYYVPHHQRKGEWGYNEVLWEKYNKIYLERGFLDATLETLCSREINLIRQIEDIEKEDNDIYIYIWSRCCRAEAV